MPTPLLANGPASTTPTDGALALHRRSVTSSRVAGASAAALTVTALCIDLPMAVSTIGVSTDATTASATRHIAVRLSPTARAQLRANAPVVLESADEAVRTTSVRTGVISAVDEIERSNAGVEPSAWYRLTLRSDAAEATVATSRVRVTLPIGAQPLWHLLRRDRAWLVILADQRTDAVRPEGAR